MTDPALLTAAAGGDTDAMEQVIRGHAPIVFAFLSGMLGDRREAEAGMQETFVRAARGIERFDPSADPETWIFTFARRVAGDLRPTPSSPLGEAPPADGNTTEWARRSLRALPLEMREVVVLKELLRWTPERIGKILGVDSAEVTHRVLLARTQMAENMRGVPDGS